MKTTKKLVSLGLVAVMAASLTACGGKSDNGTTTAGTAETTAAADAGTAEQTAGGSFKLGGIGPITGATAIYGQAVMNGAELAINEINAAGGVLGKQLELYVADDGGLADTGINATNLIASQGVVAQVGPNLSGLALAVEGIVSEAGYPMLVGATSPKLVTEVDNEWLFRIRASDSIQAELAAVYATENLGCKKIGLFTNSNDYGTGARTVAEAYFKEHGIDYVTEEHNTGDTDMTSQILKLMNEGVDCVIVWTDDAETALAARQFYDLGLDVPVIGSTSISTPQVNELCEPEWLDNWYSCTDFTTSNPSEIVQNFVENFKAAYGEEPELYATTYYGSIYIVADAIGRAGSTDPAAIRDALAATEGLEGPLATYTADDIREMVHGGTICKMVDGKAEFLEYILVE